MLYPQTRGRRHLPERLRSMLGADEDFSLIPSVGLLLCPLGKSHFPGNHSQAGTAGRESFVVIFAQHTYGARKHTLDALRSGYSGDKVSSSRSITSLGTRRCVVSGRLRLLSAPVPAPHSDSLEPHSVRRT